MNTDKEPNKPTSSNPNEANAQQQQPHRGTHQATIKESTELMKKLAEFQSHKEEVLKKISAIGERMQKRIDGLSSADVIKEELKKEQERLSNAGMDYSGEPMPKFHPEDLASMTGSAAPSMATTPVPPPIQKMTYTRIRETPKPVFAEGCFSISFPSKPALTEEWKGFASKMGDHSIQAEFDLCDDHLELKPGSKITIPLGIKVCVPDGHAMIVEAIPGLQIVSPKIITKFSNREELKITVMNQTSEPMNLLYGVNLFTCYFVRLQDGVHMNELLNSTYDDWVNGTITG